MSKIKDYSIFTISRLLPSFFPLLQIILAKYIVNNPIDFSKIIILIAIQTQLSLLIAANRDDKLFIEFNNKNINNGIFLEICKRLIYSFVFGLPLSLLLTNFINWDLSFSVIYITFIFSAHKSLDKLISLSKNENLVIVNICLSLVIYFLFLFFTKKIIFSFLFSSIISVLIYFLKFMDYKFLKKEIILFKSSLGIKNFIRDFISYEQNQVRASSMVIFLSTRLDQFALAAMASSASPFVIAYLSLKKFIDFSGNFFVLIYSKDTYKKTSIYSDEELINVYSSQLYKYLSFMVLISFIIIFITIKFYNLKSSFIILLVILSAIFNSWGSQKGPAYTRYKLQKKNLYFLVIALLSSLPIYFFIGFNLISTISSSLITALLVNFLLPMFFLRFDRKIIINSIKLLIK